MIKLHQSHTHYNFVSDLKQMRDGREEVDLEKIFDMVQDIILKYDEELEEVEDKYDKYKDLLEEVESGLHDALDKIDNL